MDEQRRSHKDLVLWRKALELAVRVHELTLRLPRNELFGLTSQMRRAAVSVPSNIAEGTARRTTKEFVAFLHVARGSLAELETQLLLAERVRYITAVDLAEIYEPLNETGRLLNAVLSGLRRRMSRRSSLSPSP